MTEERREPLPDGVLRWDPLPDETMTLLDSAPRSPGLHLSSILKKLDETLHGAKRAGAYDLNIAASIGFIWERVLELAYRSMLGVRPEEIQRDGISMSPDGIGSDPWDQVPFVCEEYKCWWRSTRRTPMDDWYVVHQNMAYCYALGTTVGVFRVLYLVGDRWMDGPKYKQWRVEYEQKALEQAWAMIVRNKHLGVMEEGKEP